MMVPPQKKLGRVTLIDAKLKSVVSNQHRIEGKSKIFEILSLLKYSLGQIIVVPHVLICKF